jgi:cell division septal protein FtsQ
VSSRASTAAGRRRAAPPAKPRSSKRAAARPSARAKKGRTQASAQRNAGAVALPRLSLPSVSIPRPRFGLPSFGLVRMLALVLLLIAAGYFAWFRHSSLVSARHVTVEGVTTSDAPKIVAALTSAGRSESTLDVDIPRLEAAVASFPTVASVSADAHFPSGLTIHVTPRAPAMLASDGSDEVPVAADGTILTGLELTKDQTASLPVLHVKTVHDSGRLGGDPLGRALVVGAAPAPLRPLIDEASTDPDTGITLTMRGGFRIEFGTSDSAAQKWAAAAAVLADPKLDTLAYVDVSIPGRPAVGGQ